MAVVNENLPPMVVNALMKDVRKLLRNPPEGIQLYFQEDNMSNITADINGPVGTPFAGGVFRVKLILTSDFPSSPPKGFFVTKIFHPNVSEAGEICVNTLKKDWKPELGIEHVLMVIRCLLIVPNADSALNPEAGKLLQEDYADFAQRARMMTRIHAKSKQPAESSSSSSSAANANKNKLESADKSASESKGAASSGSASPPKKLKAKTDKKKAAAKKSLRRL